MKNNELGRNVRLTQLAGRLRARGADEAAILDELMTSPERDGLPEREVRAIARSIASKPAGEPRPSRDELAKLDALDDLARRRGWNVAALRSLGFVGHDSLDFNGKTRRRVVSIPMRDATGAIVSRRLRRADGMTFGKGGPKALSEKGKPLGLFFNAPLPADVPIVVVEGEADAAAALSARASAVVATPGCTPGSRVLDELQKLAAGRECILFPDPDAAGREWLRRVGARLRNVGCRVQFVPSGELDLDDRLKREVDRAAALQTWIDDALDFDPARFAAEPAADGEQRDDARPTIVLSGRDLGADLAAVTRALATSGRVFRLGSIVVEAARNHADGLRFRPLDADGLTDLLARGWLLTRPGRDGTPVPCAPDLRLCKAFVARPPDAIPETVALADAPFVRDDGSIVARPGLDAATGTLADFLAVDFAPAVTLADGRPKLDDARAAASRLRQLVDDFPFVSHADAAAWVSLLLSLVARPSLAGAVPLFCVTADMPGTGKGRLIDLAATIAHGRRADVSAFPPDASEGRKLVTALLSSGRPLVCFDNVPRGRPLKGPWLDALLTCGTWRDRVLGSSDAATLPNRSVWSATGNGMQFGGDLLRRVVVVRLKSRHARPESRDDFHHPDILAHVAEHRARYLGDALLILRAHILAGRPAQRAGAMGSFEAWSRVVRGAVEWATGLDPLAPRLEIGDTADETRTAGRALLTLWDAIDPAGDGVRASQIERWLAVGPPDDLARVEFRAAIESLAATPPRGRDLSAHAIGKALQRVRDAWIGSERIVANEDRRGFLLWRLERWIDPDGPGGVATEGPLADEVPTKCRRSWPARATSSAERRQNVGARGPSRPGPRDRRRAASGRTPGRPRRPRPRPRPLGTPGRRSRARGPRRRAARPVAPRGRRTSPTRAPGTPRRAAPSARAPPPVPAAARGGPARPCPAAGRGGPAMKSRPLTFDEIAARPRGRAIAGDWRRDLASPRPKRPRDDASHQAPPESEPEDRAVPLPVVAPPPRASPQPAVPTRPGPQTAIPPHGSTPHLRLARRDERDQWRCFVNRPGRRWPVWLEAGPDGAAALRWDRRRGDEETARADALAALADLGLTFPCRWLDLIAPLIRLPDDVPSNGPEKLS